MYSYERLLLENKIWAAGKTELDPEYFQRLSQLQTPEFLWIGCSDSRVPANEITGTQPGEIFVHRNVANLVINTDVNLLSVLDFAVNHLKVKHVIVCGHYGCGGVAAAMSDKQFGLIDNWLTNIKDVMRLHESELSFVKDEDARLRRLVELNVVEQVHNLAKTSIIQNAMRSENPPELHGLVYDIREGLLRDLQVDIEDFKKFNHIYESRATAVKH